MTSSLDVESPRRIPNSRSLAVLAACLFCAACAEGSGSVTRMVNGVRYEGRFVNPEAYAAYTVGIEHETRGEYQKAVTWYLEAHSDDPASPEIWARLGAARCFGAEAKSGPGAAAQAFDNGVRLDPNYYGNYFERARCEERARLFGTGLADAIAAVDRRPGDEPSNLLVARLMQAQGRAADARAWLEAFESFREASPAMSRALDAARKPSSGAVTGPSELAAVPASTTRSGAFADLRAGKLEAARKKAAIELGADPTNSDAWIATLVACDALRDVQCFDSALESLHSPALAPSETGLAFLRELLLRRAGAQMAR